MMPHSSHEQKTLCSLNGKIIPFEQARLPVYDLAIMQGATITERLRTFRHRPYGVEAHLNRLQQSLMLVNWKGLPDLMSLEKVIEEIAQHNCQFIGKNSDLAIVFFISAGQALSDANGLTTQSKPTVCVYTAPLPFANWVDGYLNGVDLITPDIRQIPRASLDPRIKMRSRLHWQIADQIVREQNPCATALLLDENDNLTETSSGNFLIVKDGAVLTPRESCTLDGISRGHVIQFCNEAGIPMAFTDLSEFDACNAEEAFLTSSTYCIMPVATLNGKKIGNQTPGNITQRLTHTWAKFVGTDFVQQARREPD
jgi:branched-chain amino acid aminotransferase